MGRGTALTVGFRKPRTGKKVRFLRLLLLNITVSNTTVAFIVFLAEMRHVELLPDSRW